MESKLAAIILAGGKGTRMGNKELHKSLFEINGVPTIFRLLDTLRSTTPPIDTNVIVVGAYAEQIMGHLAPVYGDIAYVYQPEQKGTGNAAKYGAQFLETIPTFERGEESGILIVTGDSYLEARPLEELIQTFQESKADLAFLTVNKEDRPFAGRIIKDAEGNIVKSMEYWDIRQKSIMKNIYAKQISENPFETYDEFSTYLLKEVKEEKYVKRLFPDFLTLNPQDSKKFQEWINLLCNRDFSIEIRGELMDPDEVESAVESVNISVYLVRPSALHTSLKKILRNNVQNEEYLTDIIELISDMGGKVVEVPCGGNDVLSFNNPTELLKIEEHLAEKQKAQPKSPKENGLFAFHSVLEWLKLFKTEDNALYDYLAAIYCLEPNDLTCKSPQILQYLEALEGYGKKFSYNDKVVIERTPGRLNLMGRHIDHRGGYVNMMALDREAILIASPRSDDYMVAYNREEVEFPPQCFSISEIISLVDWADWFSFLEHERINDLVRQSQGDWFNYLKAAALRLQVHMKQKQIKGLNMFVVGNIPQAAGLSSSSALVVGTLDILSYFNQFPLKPRKFIDLCGEGEWFVGTRGGNADHAAIKMSERNRVTQIGFFPFNIVESAPFPLDYNLLVVDSKIKATKSGEMLLQYNEKVCAYDIGLAIIRQRYPELASKLKHLRDLDPDRINISKAAIYTYLKELPQEITIELLPEYLSEPVIEQLTRRFPNFPTTRKIPLRAVVLYGLGEIQRAKKCLQLLKAGKMQELGQLMNISHDGDRVVKYDDGQATSFAPIYDNNFLERAIRDDLPLAQISGHYACSIPEIDYLVDTALSLSGVLGAQISGAGLGGCMMVLLEKTETTQVAQRLSDAYHDKFHKLLEVVDSAPVQGATLLIQSPKKEP